MKEINITEKTSTDQPRWLTIFRIALGLILFWKGITFLRDNFILESMISSTGVSMFDKNSSLLASVISYINLLGGLFIATGLFTRTSCIIQIPVLIVAVLVNIRGTETSASELILSVVVLALLIVFAFKGSSTLSADEYFRSYYKAGSEEGNTKKFFNK